MTLIARRAAILTTVLLVGCGAAKAADFTLENVTIDSPGSVYHAPRIEFSGASMTKGDAQKLMSAADPRSGAERIAAIDAARISIPELTTETKTGDYAQTFVYRDLVMQNVAHGVAATLDASGASLESQRGDSHTSGRFGAMHAEGVDFPAAVRMTAETRKSADEPKRQTTASFTMASMSFDMAQNGKVSAEHIVGRNFSGRPLAAPMSALVELAPKTGAAPSETQQRAAGLMMTDLLGSVDVGALSMDNVLITRDAAASKTGDAVSMKVAHVAIDGMANGKMSNLSLEGIENKAERGAFKLDRIALSGLDTLPMFEAAAKSLKATPRFDHMELSGLSAAPEEGPVKLGRVVIDAKNWQGGAPTAVRADMQNFDFSLAGEAAQRAPMLVALGYDHIDLGATIDASLDPDKKELTVTEASLHEDQIGAARIGAFLTHVSPDLLSGEADAMKSALAAIVFWKADLHLQNGGVLDRYVAAQSKETGKPTAAVRENLAIGGRALVRSLFITGGKPNPQVDRVAEAVADFVKGAKNFDLSLFAPDGIGAIDLMMAGQLGSLAERLKIEAKVH
ncbi:MAG: hypothetical protein KGM42_11430 [Hyphomicrobiales bacterium]|nr:hypothetical protein [Hyphomicrobiales bacterium]